VLHHVIAIAADALAVLPLSPAQFGESVDEDADGRRDLARGDERVETLRHGGRKGRDVQPAQPRAAEAVEEIDDREALAAARITGRQIDDQRPVGGRAQRIPLQRAGMELLDLDRAFHRRNALVQGLGKSGGRPLSLRVRCSSISWTRTAGATVETGTKPLSAPQ